eukprot:Gb_05669 [translate_table: standard]
MAQNNSNVVQYQIIFFSGENFEYWSIKVKTFLTSQDLWTLVSTGFTEPTDENTYNALITDQKLELKENMKKDEKALFIIQTRIDISIFPKIAECTKSQDAWEILEKAYKGSTKDRRIIEKLLRSLPRKFDLVTIAIEESRDLSQLTLIDFLVSLKTHKDRLKGSKESLDQVFQSKMKVEDKQKQFFPSKHEASTSSSSSFRGGRGHGRARGRGGHGRGRSNNHGRIHLHCNYCNKDGHIE